MGGWIVLSALNRNLPNWIGSYVEYTKHMEAPDLFHMWTAIGTIGMSLLREVEEIHFGPDSVTWQALTEAFVDAQDTVKDVGPMSALTIAASELGTFLDPRNREMIDVLCDLWDGRNVPWKRRTKGEGTSEIRNPWLNFLGCTTPGWLEENFPEYAIKGGFTSRTVFVYADAKRDLVAYPGLRMDEFKQEFATLRRHLINDLRKIAAIQGQYFLSPAAFEWGHKWYEAHWDPSNYEHLDKETHGGYLARKQTHIHKVAMILAAATSNEMVLTDRHLEQADYLVTQLEDQMVNVFRHISDNRDAMLAMQMLDMLRAGGENGIGKQSLWKLMIYRCSHEEFERGLKGLIMAGLAREYTHNGVVKFRHLLQDKDRGASARPGEIVTRWEELSREADSGGN
jgi:hypothetical protein